MPEFPYSETEIVAFLRRDVPVLLARFGPAQRPAWGQMTAQHMVEHLAGAVRLSMGRYGVPAPPSSPALDRMQAHLLANAPFPANIRNPLMAPTPGALRLPSLSAAASGLLGLLDEFFDHYAQHPAATAVHPMFGTLGFWQWQAFHFKHFAHHFEQFGLLESPLLPRSEGKLAAAGPS